MLNEDYLLFFSGYVSLQSAMEWPGNVSEDNELQASGMSCELKLEYFQKDIKDKLDSSANRSVKIPRHDIRMLHTFRITGKVWGMCMYVCVCVYITNVHIYVVIFIHMRGTSTCVDILQHTSIV